MRTTSETFRIGIVELRSKFRPRAWREMRTVRVEFCGVGCDVEIVQVPGAGVMGAAKLRRYLRCPSCTRLVHTIGIIAAVHVDPQWRCRSCAGWRSGNKTLRRWRPGSAFRPNATVGK